MKKFLKTMKANFKQGIPNKITGLILTFVLFITINSTANELSSIGLHVIPYPQKVFLEGNAFEISKELTIILDKKHSDADLFAAKELIKDLKDEWGIQAKLSENRGAQTIVLTYNQAPKTLKAQGYQIKTSANELTVSANDEAGLFYGSRTLLQLIKTGSNGFFIPGLTITDWPDIEKRAAHYDTKHHQDKRSYVESFIKDLATYKINQLVWEWEDKLAYESHPDIGAPGAFTIQEMQELTRFAKNYHIELIPLVQGLGHVSFILKWPQYSHLNEVAGSNWEFCPLKEGTYDLLFDLWEEAIEATPGSEFIHIGSDETFELAECDECKVKAGEVGKSGVYHLFVNKAADKLQELGRKVMVWERPMGWEMNSSPLKGMTVAPGLVLTESYHYETADFHYVKESKKHGFEVYVYDPNPGLEPLFLPYKYRQKADKIVSGSMENSFQLLSAAALSGEFDGMINTSWDDSGLHNQMWMLSFATSAEYSWSGSKPTLPEFEASFYKNYYGQSVMDMGELYQLLNEASYFYAWTLERNVWHHGEIGKTHLPDLPRNDNMEYDPYWNTEYREKVQEAKNQMEKLERVSQIIENNKKAGVKNAYDFELYQSIAELVKHTCLTYMDLSNLEYAITRAHRLAYIDKQESYDQLARAAQIVESSLERRQNVFNALVETWEKTRLPKGMSTPGKAYFYQQDRARHFAHRTADMSYLIYDEQLLNLEGYLKDLKTYMEYYRQLWSLN
jgi:hexosaminidase